MEKTIYQFWGTGDLLAELKQQLDKEGVQADLLMVRTLHVSGVDLQTLWVGAVPAAVSVIIAYIRAKRRSRKVVVQKSGKKITVEANSPEEVKDLLKSAERIMLEPVKSTGRRKTAKTKSPQSPPKAVQALDRPEPPT